MAAKKTSELDQIIDDAIAGAGGGAAGGDQNYDDEALAFLKGIYTGDGMDDPKRPGTRIYRGGILAGVKRISGGAAVSYIQKLLVKAGLLDPDDISHPGSPADGATRQAMAMAREAQRSLGTVSVLDTLEVLSSQFGGWDKIKAERRAVFVPPAREKQSAKDISQAVRVTAQEFMGRDASEEEINQVLLKVRASEDEEYHGVLADQRAAYEAGTTGKTPGAVTVERAASPTAIAEEEFLESEEGLTWSVGKGIMGLLGMMQNRGGNL